MGSVSIGSIGERRLGGGGAMAPLRRDSGGDNVCAARRLSRNRNRTAARNGRLPNRRLSRAGGS